jgi:hypothetical protein
LTASQTLIVSSLEPDTMVAPSGEKDTDITQWLCALCFSALSSREAVASVGALSFGLGEEHMAGYGTCIPDFDRLVIGARHDGLAIRGKGHGAHVVAVRALLLRLELQGSCSKRVEVLSFGLCE